MGVSVSGRVVQISVSGGGVPKLAVASARVTRDGIEGDAQRDRRFHGGPERAVCVWSLQVIEALRAEGHPVVPGGAGENLTVSGLDWSAVRPGARLRLAGGVELEVTDFAAPCRIIQDSFTGHEFERISDKQRRGSSRVYCRVLSEGRVTADEGVTLIAASPGTGAGTGAGAGPSAPPQGC